MRWFKDNWYWIFAVFCVLAAIGIIWLLKENGELQAWTVKPLSQANMGDATTLIFILAFLNGIYRK